MKVKEGASNLKMPPFGMVAHVSYVDERIDIALIQIGLQEMDDIRDDPQKCDVRGTPVYFVARGNRLEFWPCADKDMEIKVQYFGPLREV